MIKRVIFDIDNTLIPWKAEYYNEINKVLEELKIKHTEEDYNNIIDALNKYEYEYYTFDKDLMSEYVNKYTKKQYPKDLIYKSIDKWAECVPNEIDIDIQNILEYLKDKYQLVILTDWYAEQQIKRLEKMEISKYFEHVYSAEKTKRKPFKEAFLNAIGENKPEECIMIGDNLERDIEGALNAGLKAIHYNPNNENKNVNEYYKINNFNQLRNIL